MKSLPSSIFPSHFLSSLGLLLSLALNLKCSRDWPWSPDLPSRFQILKELWVMGVSHDSWLFLLFLLFFFDVVGWNLRRLSKPLSLSHALSCLFSLLNCQQFPHGIYEPIWEGVTTGANRDTLVFQCGVYALINSKPLENISCLRIREMRGREWTCCENPQARS